MTPPIPGPSRCGGRLLHKSNIEWEKQPREQVDFLRPDAEGLLHGLLTESGRRSLVAMMPWGVPLQAGSF